MRTNCVLFLTPTMCRSHLLIRCWDTTLEVVKMIINKILLAIADYFLNLRLRSIIFPIDYL